MGSIYSMDCAFSVPGVIRGYHVYQRMWTPFIGEKATTAREPGNQYDRYAVAVLEDQTLCTVGHIPRDISKECSFFILRGGVIDVEVTGPRQKSTIPDMGMEIPCVYTFTHRDPLLLKKAIKLLAIKGFEGENKPEPKKLKRKKEAEGENDPKRKRQK